MKLLVTRPLPDEVIEGLPEGYDVSVRQDTAPMSEDDMVAALQDYDAILPTLRDPLSKTVIEAATPTRAKILANFGVGYNHIDVKAAKAAGIVVTNTPGAVTDATADIAMTLILMTCRRAGEGERMVRAGEWEGWHPTQLLGMHLGGKTLGIIGMGRIGKAIAKRAQAGFGMKIIYLNRSTVNDVGVPATAVGSLPALCNAADVVVVAVPATPETHHMMNAEAFAAMKPHGVFINIARGDIVDEAALIDALQTGQIAGAGLDVYEFEPEVPEALRQMENVTLLPHLGTSALEVRIDMGRMAVANLAAWVNGKDLPNPV